MVFGKIVVIKRNGTDGAHFPLTASSCLFGRSNECDIRIQLPTVSKEHCRMDVHTDAQVFLTNLSKTNPTQVNGKILESVKLQHSDVITISDRLFRFEFAPDSKYHPRNQSPGAQEKKRTPYKILTPKSKPPLPTSAKPTSPLTPRVDNKPAKTPRSKTPEKTDPQKTKPAASGSGSSSPDPSGLKENEPVLSSKHSTSPGHNLKTATPIAVPSLEKVSKKRANVSPERPYRPPTKERLRSSISELRGRSKPIKEKAEEDTVSPIRRKSIATPSQTSGRKRKLSGYNLLSAKRKRVSFGPNLSPEQFDKTLPPATPVRKGSAPRRKSEPVIVKDPAQASVSEGSPKEVKSTSKSALQEKVASTTRSPPRSSKKSPKVVSSKVSKFTPARTSKPITPGRLSNTSLRSPSTSSLVDIPQVNTSASGTPKTAKSPKQISKQLSPRMASKSPKSCNIKTSPAKTEVSSVTPGTATKSTSRPAKTSLSRSAFSVYGPNIPASTPVSSRTIESPTRTPKNSVSKAVILQKSRKSLELSSKTSKTPTERSQKSSPLSLETLRTPSGKTQKSSPLSLRTSKTPTVKTQTPFPLSLKTLKTGKSRKSSASSPKTLVKSPQKLTSTLSPPKTPKSYVKSPRRSLASSPNILIASSSEVGSTNLLSAMSPNVTSSFSDLPIKTPSEPFTRSPKRAAVQKAGRYISRSPASISTSKSASEASEKAPTTLINGISYVKTPASDSKLSLRKVKSATSLTISRRKTSPVAIKSRQSARLSVSDASLTRMSNGLEALESSPVEKLEAAKPTTFGLTTPKAAKSPEHVINDKKSAGDTPKATKRHSAIISEPTPEAARLSKTPRSVKSPEPKPQAVKSSKTPRSVKSPEPTPQSVKSSKTPRSVKSPEPSPQSAKTPRSVKSPEPSPHSVKSSKTFRTVKSPQATPQSVKSSKTPRSVKSPETTPQTVKSSKTLRTVKSPETTPQAVKSSKTPRTVKSPETTPQSVKSSKTPRSVKSPETTPQSVKSSKTPRTVKSPETTPQSVKSSKTPRTPKPESTSEATVSSAEIGKLKKSTPKAGESARKSEKSPTRISKEFKSPNMQSIKSTPQSEKYLAVRSKAVNSREATPCVDRTPVTTKSPKQIRGKTPKALTSGSTTPKEKKSVNATPRSNKRSAANTPLFLSSKKVKLNNSTEKLICPPADVNKIVALRAIHRHSTTPRLHSAAKKTSGRLDSARKVMKKTPKKLWTDVVKSGVPVQGGIQKTTTVKPIRLVKIKKSVRTVQKTPRAKTAKTPRAIAHSRAPTTGHVDSPVTLLVGKLMTTHVKTPIALPKRGRKIHLKDTRKSQGKTCYDGLTEMFKTPSPGKTVSKLSVDITETVSPMISSPRPSMDKTPHSLYEDIPDTPNGPGEMFVSPLSSGKKTGKQLEKTPSLIGVKNQYKKTNAMNKSPNLVGVRDLFRNTTKMDADVGGVKRLFSTPKVKQMPSSPSGLDVIFKTPEAKLPEKRKPVIQRSETVEDIKSPPKKKVKMADKKIQDELPAEDHLVRKTQGRKVNVTTCSPNIKKVSPKGRKKSSRDTESPKLPQSRQTRTHTDNKISETQVQESLKSEKTQHTRKSKTQSQENTSPGLEATQKKQHTRKSKTQMQENTLPELEVTQKTQQTRKMRIVSKENNSPQKDNTPETKKKSQKGKKKSDSVGGSSKEEKKVMTSRGRRNAVISPQVDVVTDQSLQSPVKKRTRRGQITLLSAKKLSTPKQTRGRTSVKNILKQMSPLAHKLTSEKFTTPKQTVGRSRRSKSSDIVQEDKPAARSKQTVNKLPTVEHSPISQHPAKSTVNKNRKVKTNKTTRDESATVAKVTTPKQRVRRGKMSVSQSPLVTAVQSEPAEVSPVKTRRKPAATKTTAKTVKRVAEKTVQEEPTMKKKRGDTKLKTPLKSSRKKNSTAVSLKKRNTKGSQKIKTPVKELAKKTKVEDVLQEKTKLKKGTKLKTTVKKNTKAVTKRTATPVKTRVSGKKTSKDSNTKKSKSSAIVKSPDPVKKISAVTQSVKGRSHLKSTPVKRVTRSRH